jgi:hypothetical protein
LEGQKSPYKYFNSSAKSASSTLVWQLEKGCFVTATAQLNKEWQVRFMSGLHAWIGDRRKHDGAIAIEQMLASYLRTS